MQTVNYEPIIKKAYELLVSLKGGTILTRDFLKQLNITSNQFLIVLQALTYRYLIYEEGRYNSTRYGLLKEGEIATN